VTDLSTAAAASTSGPGTPPRAVICDLDGVVWLAREAIPGAAAAIAELRTRGTRVLFVTNNSFSRHDEVVGALAAIGIPADGDLLSSADAAAQLLTRGERALVSGGPGIVEALERRGVAAASAHEPRAGMFDAVLVGFDRSFDFDSLRRASGAAREGARLIGTNDDATYPTPDGPIPGGGALLAAVSTASGVTPVIAGKPHEPMAALVRRELGPLASDGAVVMVGDRPETDGAFAARLGVPFGLVRTGVTPPGTPVEPPPAIDATDLPDLVARLLSGAGAAHRPSRSG